jgi:uncharacterized protein YgiM (DUF1202 family)
VRRLLALVLLLQALHVGVAHAAQPLLELVVAEPYLEMHSGPGRGFPVVYVVGRDEVLTVLYSRTDWYKVRAPRGPEGWVRRADLSRTKLASGEPAPIPPYPDFTTHRWEMGAGYGVYNRQNLVSAYVDYAITDSLDIEAVLQQALGTLSPTASIGTGYQYIEDKVPPAPLQDSNQMAYASLGARGFITRRFMWRFDWRAYVVFNRLNVNEELEEWKFGLAVFF